ncbi:hypothetical protein [Candidatus Synchoanobacter obligatus]|uniref:ABC transmembrane type-1 domain-containing protein n=1 Tax=Candidatus Synchoanobacter obligatus TaxID=2919597 RepID=A0ABT1L4F9_9GAMM|nr:hypothetical protein [Candidatus Synchoanobacter obligatus]MCP8352059.1 hypothetical protein [Candidatus Synchoanobacter obligatus]
MAILGSINDFFILWTQPPHENNTVTYSQRVNKLRWFYRLNAFEVLLNAFKGTMLRYWMVIIQKATQSIFQLQQAGESIAIPMMAFMTYYPIYIFATLGLCLVTFLARQTRTKAFYEAHNLTSLISYWANNVPDEPNLKEWKASVTDDSNGENLINIPKGYFNITQNLLLGPLELSMYLVLLGPEILLSLALLSIVSGYIKVQISEKMSAAREGINTALAGLNDIEKSPAQSSDPLKIQATTDKVKEYIGSLYKQKSWNIYNDITSNLSSDVFQIILIGLSTYFVALGRFDLAMVMVQSNTALLASVRIRKYLELIDNYNKFKDQVNIKKVAYDKYTTCESVDQLVASLPEYNMHWLQRCLMYMAFTITVSGAYLGINPIAFILPYLTTSLPHLTLYQMVTTALTTWGLISIYSTHIKTDEVGSGALNTALGTLLFASAAGYAVTLWPMVLACVPIVMNAIPFYSLASVCYLGATYIFDRIALKPLLFTFDQIGIWASQDIVEMAKMPCTVSTTIYESLPSWGKVSA